MTIYEALHNSDTFESTASTISIHKTKEGAENAIRKSKERVKKEHDILYKDFESDHEWNFGHWWGIRENQLEY